MKHILSFPSLAPFDHVYPLKQTRRNDKLMYPHGTGINGDQIAGLIWEDINRSCEIESNPTVEILCKILPTISRTEMGADQFEHKGVFLSGEDVAILSGHMQWFGTNCGQSFVSAQGDLESSNLDFLNSFKGHVSERGGLIIGASRAVSSDKVGRSLKRYRDLRIMHAALLWLSTRPGLVFLRRLDNDLKACHEAYVSSVVEYPRLV